MKYRIICFGILAFLLVAVVFLKWQDESSGSSPTPSASPEYSAPAPTPQAVPDIKM